MSESKSDALTNLATPLHRTEAFRLQTAIFSVRRPPDQRMLLQTAAHSCDPSRRQILRNLRQGALEHARSGKHRAARTAHPAIAEALVQHARRLGHLGANRLGR